MTAARSDAVHPAPAPVAPTGEWPVAPRFSVVPVAAPIAAAPAPMAPVALAAPEAPAAPAAPVAPVEPAAVAPAEPVIPAAPSLPAAPVAETPEPVAEAVVETPEPIAEAIIETPEPVAGAEPEMPEPVASIEVAQPAPVIETVEPVATPEMPEPGAMPEMPEPVAAIDTSAALPVPTEPETIVVAPAPLAAAAPVVSDMPESSAPIAAPAPAVHMPAPYAPIMVTTPAPVPMAEVATPILISPLPTGAPVAPHLASPLQAVPAAPLPLETPQMPAAPVMPGAPVMPSAPIMPGAPVMPGAPAYPVMPAAAAPDPNAPIQLPVLEQPEGMSIAEWPIDRAADLRPDAGTSARRLGSLPNLPEIPGVSRQFLLVAALVGAAGFVAIRGLGGGEDPVAPPTPVAQTAAATWQSSLPKVLPAGDVDALTLDARELRPARVKHQLELAVTAMKPGEVIREMTVRTDGTLQLSVMHGTQERTIVTKGKAPSAPAAAAAAEGTPILAIDPIEIDARVPRKLLRAVENAKGVSPTTIDLVRSAAIRGGQPTWVMRWTPAGKPATTVYATQDGKQLASTAAGLK
ncbi:MAG: hypothetical protein J7513_06790 [Solirubrobacteraceae bacterium]|nr:hypothetical protein [Solirubrobacteraceae bacterium]